MSKKWYGVVAVGLGLAILVALFSPWASSHPDGLEKVAEEKEFIGAAEDPSYEIIPDYTFPGVENERVATVLSGLVGIAIVAGLCFGFAYFLKVSRRNRESASESG
jgi:hypothetical protein